MDQCIESVIEALERAKAEIKRIKRTDCSNKEEYANDRKRMVLVF